MKRSTLTSQCNRPGISWAPVIFLLLFLSIWVITVLTLLVPLLKKAVDAAPLERQKLKAYAALMACVMLLFLLLGLVFTLRFGKHKNGIKSEKPKPTIYPDAWSESAKRMKTPAPEELEEENE